LFDLSISDPRQGSASKISSKKKSGILHGELIKYPQDNFDRLWESGDLIFKSPISYLVSSGESISIDNTEDLPPTAVMQKAWISNSFQTAQPHYVWAPITRREQSVNPVVFCRD